jgi:ubiquinone/menaquinone biosynthesis C-methylase UbiE
LSFGSLRRHDDERIAALYDRRAGLIELVFGKTTEDSPYRKMTIAKLGLTEGLSVLDVGCGVGFNFKAIESYLHNTGAIVGIDISSESLKIADKLVSRRKWTNVQLLNTSITAYRPKMRFDGILCTFALEIIAEYEKAIESVFSLLKPGGKFAMLGMKTSSEFPYMCANMIAKWVSRKALVSLDRNLARYIESRAKILSYQECFHGFYFVLSASRSDSPPVAGGSSSCFS